MAAKRPFRMTGPATVTGIGRAPDGKFVRLEAATVEAVRQMAVDEGIKVDEVIRRERVPDFQVPAKATTDTATGTVQQANSIPWPPAGPVNDADRPPMRLKG